MYINSHICIYIYIYTCVCSSNKHIMYLCIHNANTNNAYNQPTALWRPM